MAKKKTTKKKTARKRSPSPKNLEIKGSRPDADDEMDEAFEDLEVKRAAWQDALTAQTEADKALVVLAIKKGLLVKGGRTVYFGPSGRGVNIGVPEEKPDEKKKMKCSFFTPKDDDDDDRQGKLKAVK